METNFDRTLIVFAAIGLCLWLVLIAPDEVKQGFLVNILALMSVEMWARGQDARS